MRLDQFDLNLLIAFDALLAERNVTQAARRLNLTQSAMSAALKRLRQSLGDDILVQHGKKMIPTSRALALAPEVSAALQGLRGLIASASDFDPRVSTRHFRIAASDYITVVLIAPLLARLQAAAPQIRIEITLPDEGSLRELDDGELDLLLTPKQFVSPDHPSDLLFTERHVVVGCANNPVLRDGLTLEAFDACGHISVAIEGRPTFIEAALRGGGDQRRIELVAPSFLLSPWMLRGTTRLALMHERLARLVAGPLSLRLAECPVPLPPMSEMMQCHAARLNDPGLTWLRGELRDAARATDPG